MYFLYLSVRMLYLLPMHGSTYYYHYCWWIVQVRVTTHLQALHLICKCDAWGRSIYKSDTNQMEVSQLHCFMVHEWIKSTLSLCLAWRTILYCWSCAEEWCGVFSWWKALGFHVIDPIRIYHVNSLNLPCIWILYTRNFDTTNQLTTGIICMKVLSTWWLHHG